MLGTDLVPARHLGNNRSQGVGLRDDPALLLVAPATTLTHTSPDFDPAPRLQSVKYTVDHVCEPISSKPIHICRFTDVPARWGQKIAYHRPAREDLCLPCLA